MSNNDTTAILDFLRARFARVDETLAKITERQIARLDDQRPLVGLAGIGWVVLRIAIMTGTGR